LELEYYAREGKVINSTGIGNEVSVCRVKESGRGSVRNLFFGMLGCVSGQQFIMQNCHMWAALSMMVIRKEYDARQKKTENDCT
jgi:hypothetical protein